MEVKVTYSGHTTAFEHDSGDGRYNDAQARRVLETWIDEDGSDGPGARAEGWDLTKLTTSPKHPGRVWVTFTSTDADPKSVDFRWDVVKANGHTTEDTPPAPAPAAAPPVEPAAGKDSKTDKRTAPRK